ncbi:MAG: thrombospondin type 3 repeat-containing protein, partial [Verrucomicrobiota bacterium]
MCNRLLKCLIVLACLAAGLIPAASFAQRVDLNGNGMSDIWDLIHNAAAANPISDSDGDGVINGLEAVAGTNPFDATSLPSISLYARSSTNFSVSLWSALGKRYELQSVTNLGSSNWVMEANTIARTGTVVTLTAPATSTTKFFKVLMADVDTDGDGVNDWEEYKLGLDPLSAASNGTLDSNGQPSSDFAFVTGKLAVQNVVTISASTPTAVQPDVGQVATSLGTFNVTRGGFPLNEITVNLGLGGPGTGFAVENLDHEVLLRPITLPAGVGSVNVPLVPLANANRKTPVVAML